MERLELKLMQAVILISLALFLAKVLFMEYRDFMEIISYPPNKHATILLQTVRPDAKAELSATNYQS